MESAQINSTGLEPNPIMIYVGNLKSAADILNSPMS